MEGSSFSSSGPALDAGHFHSVECSVMDLDWMDGFDLFPFVLFAV